MKNWKVRCKIFAKRLVIIEKLTGGPIAPCKLDERSSMKPHASFSNMCLQFKFDYLYDDYFKTCLVNNNSLSLIDDRSKGKLIVGDTFD